MACALIVLLCFAQYVILYEFYTKRYNGKFCFYSMLSIAHLPWNRWQHPIWFVFGSTSSCLLYLTACTSCVMRKYSVMKKPKKLVSCFCFVPLNTMVWMCVKGRGQSNTQYPEGLLILFISYYQEFKGKVFLSAKSMLLRSASIHYTNFAFIITICTSRIFHPPTQTP